MCGIFAILGLKIDPKTLRAKALALSKRLRHRGPDWSGIWIGKNSVLTHERLGIVDPSGGAQPLLSADKKIALTVNGEIYNHKELRAAMKSEAQFLTESDCEIILHLYKELGPEELCNKLNGQFSFVLQDDEKDTFFVARDPIGITPLYYGTHKDGSMWFASECKALQDDLEEFFEFPPGFYYTPETGLKPYYNPVWYDPKYCPDQKCDLSKLRKSLETATVQRMMSDVPYGVLLSGGLDSSLVASIVVKHSKMRIEDKEQTKAWWPQVHSFAIGLETSPDLKAAAKAAEFLGTIHHSFIYTVQDGLDALRDVIHHLETYDVTTIRASTPMYFLARKIKALGVKMVIGGEGADEIFGGYLYFDKAPSAQEYQAETARRVRGLHFFDCLRANKSTMAWGLEVRVPFLDRDFLDTALTFDPTDKLHYDADGKRRIEKWILRKAFDVEVDGHRYLPDSILWRQKEQFSDGVGYGWIDGLKATAAEHVTDSDMAKAAETFPVDPPKTKEAYFYRQMFQEIYPHPSASKTVDNWVPTWGLSKDPSGRVHSVHQSATIENN